MITEIISAVLQVAVFTLIPLIGYLIFQKPKNGFFNYIGLVSSNTKANLLGLGISLFFLMPPIILSFISDEFLGIMHDPESMTGKFKEMGFGARSILILLVAAIFKTALAEEILFRDFLAKRLIGWLGFQTGNILQPLSLVCYTQCYFC